MAKKDTYVECEICGARVKKKNLRRHMSHVHIKRDNSETDYHRKSDVNRPVDVGHIGLKMRIPIIITAIAIITVLVALYVYYTPTHREMEGSQVQWEKDIPPLTDGTNTMVTSDGWKIYATFHSVNDSRPAVLFLHGMNENREVWDELAGAVNKEGFSTLAIDLRGHGESTMHNGNRESVKDRTISEEDISAMALDASAALEALKKTGIKGAVIIGASIGANVALVTAWHNPYVVGVVLLSPGFNYHGIQTKNAAMDYGQRPAIVASARGDPTNTYEEAQSLASYMGTENVETYFYDSGSEHGTNLLRYDDLYAGILEWLETHF